MIDLAITSMAHELLSRGEALRFTARGQSMWPYLRDGDVVEILPRKLPVSVGDIVFVPNVEFGQLHRVIALDRCGRALVRGDALHEPDGWFDLKQISGVLGTVVRRGRLVRVRRDHHAVRMATVLGAARRLVHRIRHRRLGS